MNKTAQPSNRFPSAASLIAWLSVCMLAGAWGRTLNVQWQEIWAEMGAFGLVAAVGLGGLQKAREARQQRMRDRVMNVRLECGLQRLNQHSAAVDSIHAAVRELAQFAGATRSADEKPSRLKRRMQAQQLTGLPLEITGVEESGTPLHPALTTLSGSLKEISSRAVSFEHADELSTRMVLLTFQLGQGKQLSFVVDVLWTEPGSQGHLSGGTVLAVGVPQERSRCPI